MVTEWKIICLFRQILLIHCITIPHSLCSTEHVYVHAHTHKIVVLYEFVLRISI